MSVESENHVMPIQLQELFNPPLNISHLFGEVVTESYDGNVPKGEHTTILLNWSERMMLGGFIRSSNTLGLSTGYVSIKTGEVYRPLPNHDFNRKYLLGKPMGFLPYMVYANSEETEVVYIIPYGLRSSASSGFRYYAAELGTTYIEAKLFIG